MAKADALMQELDAIWSVNPAQPDRAEVEQRVIAQTQSDPETLLSKYAARSESYDGRYVSADLMKELFSDYSASRESRARYNDVIQNSAAALASVQFRRAIHDQKQIDRKEALFITGVSGAGKTSAILANGIPENARVVYEGQLIDKSSHDKIRMAIHAGLSLKIAAILPRLETALDKTKERFDEIGRGATMEAMAFIHGKTPDGLAAINELFGSRVEIEIVDLRAPGHPRSFDYAEGARRWRQENRRGPTIERLRNYLATMRHEGRSSPKFEQHARVKASELGRYDTKSCHKSERSDQTSGGQKAHFLMENSDLAPSPTKELAKKFRYAAKIDRVADAELNGAARILAIATAHINAAYKPGTPENEKAIAIVVDVMAANIAGGCLYDFKQ